MLREWWSTPERGGLLLAVSVVTGALSHGYYLFKYPLYLTDEGIYVQQAWSVLRQFELSPYTYFYDHAPGGWVVIAGWISVLPSQFDTFGNAINSARALMLLIHLVAVVLLFEIARLLSNSNLAAFLAAFLFNCSPLAVYYQRQVLLDNLMVVWLLVTVYLIIRWESRLLKVLGAGLAFGMALITKENAIFFAPVLVYLLVQNVRGSGSHRFAKSFWPFMAAVPVGGYVLYAALKNELFPSRLSFDLENPPADHVSLLYTVWWQMNRGGGGVLDRDSQFWHFTLGAWLPKDRFLLLAGLAAMAFALYLGMRDRTRYQGFFIVSLLAASYALYLIRGSVVLEFYIAPMVPLLALNIGMVLGYLLRNSGRRTTMLVTATLMAALLAPMGGYFLTYNTEGRVQVHDLYRLPLTDMQDRQLAYVRRNIPPSANIITDEDIWANLHDKKPFYRFAHSHWKASSDPDVRDRLFAESWQNIDYIVMSNKMRQAMQGNNGDGREDWILEALDEHSRRVWDLKRGNVHLEIYQIQGGVGSP